MRVIHNGTQVISSFSIIDEAGDVIQNVGVQASQDPNDPLKFNKITIENFEKAYKSLLETKAKIEKEVAAKVEANKKVTEETE